MQLLTSAILQASQFLKISISQKFKKKKKKTNLKATLCDPGTALCGFLLHSHEILRALKTDSLISLFL